MNAFKNMSKRLVVDIKSRVKAPLQFGEIKLYSRVEKFSTH